MTTWNYWIIIILNKQESFKYGITTYFRQFRWFFFQMTLCCFVSSRLHFPFIATKKMTPFLQLHSQKKNPQHRVILYNRPNWMDRASLSKPLSGAICVNWHSLTRKESWFRPHPVQIWVIHERICFLLSICVCHRESVIPKSLQTKHKL